MIIGCKGYCHKQEFKDRFKIIKQLSGKLNKQITRLYRYCSKCRVFMVKSIICFCCGLKLRNPQKLNTDSVRSKRWRLKHPEQYKAIMKNYYEKNKSKLKQKRTEKRLKSK